MNIVKELRERAGLQQKEVAIAVGVSRPTVSEWEHQKKDPSGERLQKLATLFDVDPSVVLGYTIPALENKSADNENNDEWKFREFMRREPEYRELMDAAFDADPEHVRAAIAVINSLKKTKR